MSANAIITMIITLGLVWGGLVLGIIKLHKEETDKYLKNLNE